MDSMKNHTYLCMCITNDDRNKSVARSRMVNGFDEKSYMPAYVPEVCLSILSISSAAGPAHRHNVATLKASQPSQDSRPILENYYVEHDWLSPRWDCSPKSVHRQNCSSVFCSTQNTVVVVQQRAFSRPRVRPHQILTISLVEIHPQP